MKLNIVPAGDGIQWVKLGIRTFMKRPLALTTLTFMYMAMGAIFLATQSAVGSLGAFLIVPAATLGFMAATKEALDGRFPTVRVFLSAFRAGRTRLVSMIVLGLLYTACCVLITLLVRALIDLPALPADFDGRTQPPPEFVSGFMQRLLLGTLLYVPVSLMFWHAPALVHWHAVSPAKSIFFSTVACVRNYKAMLLYNLAWMGIMVAIFMVMMVLMAATGRPELVAGILISLTPIGASVFFTSMYFTFRDSFVADEASAEQPHPGEPT